MFSPVWWFVAVVLAAVPGYAQVAADAPTAESLLGAMKAVTERLSAEHEPSAGTGLEELTSEAVIPDAPGAGVCVSLRMGREEIGRGVAMSGPASLRLALDEAVRAAQAALPEARDVLQRSARAEQWKTITAGVELAGALVALDLETFGDAGGRVMVGVEGVAVSHNDRVEAVFPSQMLVANDTAAAALIGLVSRVTGDPTLAMPGVPGHEAGAVAASHGLRYFKFRVAHAVQTEPGGSAVPRARGGRIVMASEVTEPAMRAFAQRLSGNILAQRTAVEGRDEFFSCYWPLQDRSEEVAGVRETALACLALCEGARLDAQPNGDGSNLPAPVKTAQEILVPMLSIEGRIAAGDRTPANAAMLVVAMSELFAWTGKPKGEWFEGTRAQLEQAVVSAVDESGAWNDTTRAGERAVVALALTQLALDPVLGVQQSSTAAIASRARAEGAVRALLRDTPAAGLVMHLPWLARAELLLAGDQDVKSAAALRQVRDLAWSMQVGAAEAKLAGSDLEGGLMLASASGDATPTAQSARAFAWFGQALGDARLTDAAEQNAQRARMARALRFLRQLSLDDSWDWCVPDPARARWGVRVSPTDQRQHLDATSMTLITVSATLRGMQKK